MGMEKNKNKNKNELTTEDKWESLTSANNFLFCKILESEPDICRRILELLLHIKIERLEMTQSEQTIQVGLDSHFEAKLQSCRDFASQNSRANSCFRKSFRKFAAQTWPLLAKPKVRVRHRNPDHKQFRPSQMRQILPKRDRHGLPFARGGVREPERFVCHLPVPKRYVWRGASCL